MSAVSHSRHVCCVTHQIRLLCHTADMSAVSHIRYVCCVTQQMCHALDMSAVSHSRQVCCFTKWTRLLCHTECLTHLHLPKRNDLFSAFCEQQAWGSKMNEIPLTIIKRLMRGCGLDPVQFLASGVRQLSRFNTSGERLIW